MIARLTRKPMVLIALAGSPASGATGFAPGEWDHRTELVTADVPGIPEWLIRLAAGRGHRKTCNGPAQIGHPEQLLQGDETAICKLRTLSMKDGKIVFDTFCTNKHFPAGLLVASRGTYTPTSYAISTISTGTKDGKPVRIVTTGTGKRVSTTCTR